MDTLAGALRELALYGLVVFAFFGPIEAFLQFRLHRAARIGERHGYLALADPWIPAIVAIAGAGTVALITALS